jgi:hypothetical protein
MEVMSAAPPRASLVLSAWSLEDFSAAVLALSALSASSFSF